MVVSWYSVALLAATALGASIGLSFVPYRTPSLETTLKSEPSDKQIVEKSFCGKVWITIHSPTLRLIGKSDIVDAIELNWDFSTCATIPTQIGLFMNKPTSWDNGLIVYPVETLEGYHITHVSLGEESLVGWDYGAGLRGPQCLWPYVAAGDHNNIQVINCLKIQPTWMEDNGDKINKLRIGELAVPGTHNAGAWRFDTEISTVSRDLFVLCQDRSIWAQLVYGIRYFDFRIAYYDFYPNVEDRYWLNHNLIRVRPLVPLLREIKSFLDSTKEYSLMLTIFPWASTSTTVHQSDRFMQVF
ncbi:unnamed protein product [Leptidea sinapis]|uniref:Phosphatidylinositol-specific phospholipase C X domain-containing protein n=2 Tax=Leptidea sinapis TaxID=189913 RepID=A0A5E4Q732_9NEOP|nr:unnamed protein product [Leptidea sinapis]